MLVLLGLVEIYKKRLFLLSILTSILRLLNYYMSQIVLTDRAFTLQERGKEEHGKKIRNKRNISCRVTHNFCMKLMKDVHKVVKYSPNF